MSHKNNVIFSYININSIRNKLKDLSAIVGEEVDILSIAETKLDISFPEAQFMLANFKKPYRFDVTDTSGGLLTYVNRNITSRQLFPCLIPSDIQIIVVELKLRKHNWLLFSIYRPPSQNLKYFLENLTLLIDYYALTYENLVIMGDFNDTPLCTDISSFISQHGLVSLINTPTCFKSRDGRCVDLILTNKKHSFQLSNSFETGLSDYHHMIHTMLKQSFVHIPSKKIIYRSYRKFSKEAFKSELLLHLANINQGDFSPLHSALETTLDKHASLKKKIIRGNNKPHVNTKLRKAIMQRSRLKIYI